MTFSVSRPFWIILAGVSLALLPGCDTVNLGNPELTKTMPIAGGGTVDIPFNNKNAIHSENDDIRIEIAHIHINFKTSQYSYEFGFLKKRPFQLRRVQVEDVTDDAPVKLVDDTHPETGSDHWMRTSPEVPPDPVALKWLFEIENSVRLYRFTIETQDNRTMVVYEGFGYPEMIKRYMRVGLKLEPLLPTAKPAGQGDSG